MQLGNLLTLPVGGGLLYVEPVYVQASGGESFPLLRKVLVGFGDKVAFEDTLPEALDVLFGQATATPAPTPGHAHPDADAEPGGDPDGQPGAGRPGPRAGAGRHHRGLQRPAGRAGPR